MRLYRILTKIASIKLKIFSNTVLIQWGVVLAVAYNSTDLNLVFPISYTMFYNIQLTTEGTNHAVDSSCYEEKTLISIRVISGNQAGANKNAEVQWLAIGY